MRHRTVISGIVICIAVVASAKMLVSQDGSATIDAGLPSPFGDFGLENEPLPEPLEISKGDDLRNQYLELVKAKAELMDDATLQKEIATTQAKISELKALQKLQEAQLLLQAITDEFPDSAAAVKASRMLDAVAQADSNFGEDAVPAAASSNRWSLKSPVKGPAGPTAWGPQREELPSIVPQNPVTSAK